jgi:hypothetical protein
LPEKVAKIDLPAAKADIEDLVKLKKEAEKK